MKVMLNESLLQMQSSQIKHLYSLVYVLRCNINHFARPFIPPQHNVVIVVAFTSNWMLMLLLHFQYLFVDKQQKDVCLRSVYAF